MPQMFSFSCKPNEYMQRRGEDVQGNSLQCLRDALVHRDVFFDDG